jgi:O-antigen ligase
VVDVYGLSIGASGARYAVILLPIFLVCLGRGPSNRLTIRPPALPDYLLLILFLFGTIGSVFGIVFRSTANHGLVLFLPMALGLLHLTTLGTLDENESGVMLRRWLRLGLAYTTIAALSALGLLELIGGGGADPSQSLAGAVFAHEKAFFLCIALTAAWLLGRKWLLLAVLAGSLVGFLTYPAATHLVAGVVAVMTLVATGRRAGKPRAYALGLSCLLLLAFVAKEVTVSGPATRDSVARAYFDAVGKSNNNETRAELWSEAWEVFAKSPLVGSAFSDDVTIEVLLNGKRRAVPPHNDYLQMGMGGGVLGMGLLIAWVVVANIHAHRRFRRLQAEGMVRTMSLLRVLLVGYNSFFAIALLNPVMSRGGLNVTAMLLYAMMMTVGGRELGRGSVLSPHQGRPLRTRRL